MGAKGKKNKGENYESLIDDWRDIRKRGCMEGVTSRLCRPLRIFQFLTTLVLFAMIVYMTAMTLQHLTHLASILLIILTASYLFFMAIDMISQFDGSDVPEAPMFFFSFFGTFFFAIAGALLIYFPTINDSFWALVIAKILCFVVSALFLLEVTLLLASWRQRCLSWTKCCPYTPGIDYAQKGTKMLFPGADARVEFGHLDAVTSVSDYAVPLEDIDTAVDQHGRRRVTVGHRRQYVDNQSSAPALSPTRPAEIQTERERTVIRESQTQRIEMKEIIVQTNSRCELCNRQIEEKHSPHVPTTPYLHQAAIPEAPIQRPLGGNCAVCPAFLHMMREGMGSPCCQSCNCGATEAQRTTYLSDRTAQQPHNPEGHSPRFVQREEQRSPITQGTVKPTGSESPSTTNEKSDGERSDLLSEEGNRYRPSKNISRVYETRPCSTHACGLAARMPGLPETVTKIPTMSIGAKRNKRTQTPVKDFPISRDENKATEETITENVEERRGTCVTESRGRRSNERLRNRAKIGETGEKSSEDRMKLINEPEARRGSTESRKSGGSGTPRKLYRNSEPILVPKEPISPAPEDFPLPGACRVTTTKEETGRMMWKSERTEIRDSCLAGKPETRLAEELPIPEETLEEIDSERSRTYPKYRRAVEKYDESADSEIASGKTVTHDVVVTDLKDSPPISGPVLKLRLEKPVEDPKTTSGPTESEVSSKYRNEPVSKPNYEAGRVHRPVEPEESPKSREKPSRTRKDSYEHFPTEERKPIAEKTIKKSDEDRRAHPKDETEEIIEELEGTAVIRSDYSATNRMKRTRSVTRKDEDT